MAYDWDNDKEEVILGSISKSLVFKPKGQYEDKAFGAMFGAFIGDALGAQIRGRKGHTHNEELNRLMQMPGGGQHSLAAGQVSDESEVIISLTRSLIAGGKTLSLTKICQGYSDWAA
jgi:ADP-ribosyl-[dinitrogen reductase] hydrolase